MMEIIAEQGIGKMMNFAGAASFKRSLSAAAVSFALLGIAPQASATTVLATDSIYNSGKGSTPRTTVALNGATAIKIAATGTISLTPGYKNDPDGVGGLVLAHNVTSANGLSGISLPAGRAGSLVGVFLGSSDPGGGAPAPAALFYTLGDLALSTYSPLLNQVFFIGDGLTGDGSGLAQIFNAPSGASRLALGIADADNYQGAPGAYFDNTGSYNVSVSSAAAVPEAATWAMMLVGFGAIGAALRRRQTRVAVRFA